MADQWMQIWAAIQALPEGGRIRFMREPAGVYVLRELPDREVHYFFDGTWYPTALGVGFSEIEPWLGVYTPPDVS